MKLTILESEPLRSIGASGGVLATVVAGHCARVLAAQVSANNGQGADLVMPTKKNKKRGAASVGSNGS